jgi:hypothetical protein
MFKEAYKNFNGILFVVNNEPKQSFYLKGYL